MNPTKNSGFWEITIAHQKNTYIFGAHKSLIAHFYQTPVLGWGRAEDLLSAAKDPEGGSTLSPDQMWSEQNSCILTRAHMCTHMHTRAYTCTRECEH